MTPRVLLSAYQCGPGEGSVSQIGWEWYSRLAARTSVTLVTHIRNKKALTAAGAPLPGSEVHYIDTEWFAGPLYRLASRLFPNSQHSAFLMSSLDYFVYDRDVLKLFRTLDPKNHWDIVHAVTPVSPAGATRLHKLGLPVVLGPWNGGLLSPNTFPEIMRDDSGWMYKIRNFGHYLDLMFSTTASAAAILTATRATDESIPRKSRARCIRMLENGVNLDVFCPGESVPLPSAHEPLRIIFVGRLLPFKGVAMLMEALRRLRGEFPVELTLVGDGPLRQSLEETAHEAGISGTTHFCGALPLPAVAKMMQRSHVFCLPSVRESGGAVVLEAMACGLPVMAVNYGGPAEIVDESIGHALTAAGPEPLIEDMMQSFRDMFRNPAAWMQRGVVGRERAEHLYSWDSKIDAALEIYSKVAPSYESQFVAREAHLVR